MKTIISIFKNLKKIINNEYYVSIDHYYYSLKDASYMVAIKLKFNHNILIIKLNELRLNDKLLTQLSPYNNYILGKLFKYKQEDMHDNITYQCTGYTRHTDKSLLSTDTIDFTTNQLKLRHTYSNLVITIPFNKIIDNLLLIDSLPQNEAFDIGYRTTIIS